jgi:hypothetical protein
MNSANLFGCLNVKSLNNVMGNCHYNSKFEISNVTKISKVPNICIHICFLKLTFFLPKYIFSNDFLEVSTNDNMIKHGLYLFILKI